MPCRVKPAFDFALPDSLMRGIHQPGFQYATPIQAETFTRHFARPRCDWPSTNRHGQVGGILLTILNRLLTAKPSERFASEPRALW